MDTSTKLYGVIIKYRKGNNVQFNKEVYVKAFVTSKEVHKLIGSKVLARDSYGNMYKGKVVKVHGRRNSVVIVRFNRGIPGQLIGSTVDILI